MSSLRRDDENSSDTRPFPSDTEELSPPLDEVKAIKPIASMPSVDITSDVKQEQEKGLLHKGSVEDEKNNLPPSVPVSMNSLLRDLAKERQQLKQEDERRQKSQTQLIAQKKKKTAVPKGHKLGGITQSKKSAPPIVQNFDHVLDDMAFLDANIDQIQNSHGRNIDATGNAYCTVLNGMLLPKTCPTSTPLKKDPKVAAALQKKLQSAQEDRKAKIKKK
jgi:hypothetical protein